MKKETIQSDLEKGAKHLTEKLTARPGHGKGGPHLPGWLRLLGQTIAVTFGMFSAVPVPQPTWNERNMRYALCAFPLIGVVCGAAAGVWGWLASVWDLPVLLRAAGFCLLPVWITGGIHLDGFADTSDALASYGDKEKRLAILKDSHCGAFAVIRLCSWFVLDFALWSALPLTIQTVGCMQLGFVLERAISGWAVASLPLAKHRGLAYTFSTASDRRRVKGILTGIILVVSMALVGSAESRAGPCWPQLWPACGGIPWYRGGISAASPEIWRDGSCSGVSCGCWRPWWPPSWRASEKSPSRGEKQG